MNEKVLKTLEYDKIITTLTGFAYSDAAKEACRQLKPMTDLASITAAQEETTHALNRILRQGSLSFYGIHDVRDSMARLDVGSTLGIGELLSVEKLLTTASHVKAYDRNAPEEVEDCLTESFSLLAPLTKLSEEIRRCIPEENEISDDASPGLRQIRHAIHGISGKVHNQLNSMLANQTTRGYLQDGVVTMRDGRYCLPVKAEHRSQIPGVIHDRSATGSTLFIEPMAVVKLNNDLHDLEIKEQEEIEKILATLSNLAAEEREAILTNYEVLIRLDFIFAKAMLSREWKGNAPIFNTEGIIDLKKARHPLLDKERVVPIDIRLGETFDLLVLTGPNTGGKTVSLKTLGLFTLLGQAGLHIPTAEKPRLSVFTEVFADIGDEQSIEQNLSTFSSHMTNTVRILKQVDENSLVLFDELGAGTDPLEGAALAISILSSLHEQGIRTMATTHYSELKTFALTTPRVENASCEFDVASLRPTYRLLIGIPGKSNAFAISKKLGLPEAIIEDAKGHLTKQEQSFEEVLAELEKGRSTIEEEQAQIQEYKEEIRRLRQSLHDKNESIKKNRETILQKANEEARAILQEAKDFADESIRKFNHLGKNATASSLEKERGEIRQKLSKTEAKLVTKPARPAAKALKPGDLHIGDLVKVLSMGAEGTVSTLPDNKGMLFVQMGIIRSKVSLKDLELIDEPVITSSALTKTESGKLKLSKTASVSAELSLLGCTCDEAIVQLDKYLDDAYLAHLSQVRIVHGKGTGALRQAVHGHLKRQSYVKSYRLGEFGEGDSGVTIVEFK